MSAGPRARLREHRPFLVALALAAGLRVVVQVAFSPALVHSDAMAYLAFLGTFDPNPQRPAGYDLLLLHPLSLLSDGVLLVSVVQHLLGLLTAVVLYTFLRHRRVGRWAATVAAVPVLFDSLQLILEQTVLSDTLFCLLVLLGVAVLAWRGRPTLALALVGGLLFGVATSVRLVGEPLVLAGVFFCLVAGGSWVRRVAAALAVVVGFLVPVSVYAAWYHHEHGVYALSEFGGKSLYLRTTTFVDCSKIQVPTYERVLCPLPSDPSQRLDPAYYGFQDPLTIPMLFPPSGTSIYDAMQQFAVAAIRAQPLAYLTDVGRDFALNFDVVRTDRFTYTSVHKWQFQHWINDVPSPARLRAYWDHGGQRMVPQQPYADLMADYQLVGYTPGPVVLACVLAGLAAGLGLGRARTSELRTVCLFITVTGTGLILAPAVTGNFYWRYQLPALSLLPAAAALAWTAYGAPRLSRGRRRRRVTPAPPGDGTAGRTGRTAAGTTTRTS